MHARVDYRVGLVVTETEALERAYRSGTGPARAFGFGLLLLRPVA